MRPRPRLPAIVLMLFAVDVGFGALYGLTCLSGYSISFLDLNGESNFPTWYSSIQWFCVAALLGIFALRNFKSSQMKAWMLLILPLVFLGLSLDEVAMIHERIGHRSDQFLMGAPRHSTVFPSTGVWMFFIGLPFVVFFATLTVSIRTYFRRAPGALVKICLGMAVTLLGAIGIETLWNFVTPDSVYGFLQVLGEEMCEMFGGTIVFWGSYELLAEHGFTLGLESAAAQAPVVSVGDSSRTPVPVMHHRFSELVVKRGPRS